MQSIRSGSPRAAAMGPPHFGMFWGHVAVFFKTRMRRLLRGIVESATPDGLRADPAEVAARALTLERGAVAFGIAWQGLSPAQAALVVIHAAWFLSGIRTAATQRLEDAAERFAVAHGLADFSRSVARDMAETERLAALRRHGYGQEATWSLVQPSLAA